MTPDWADTVTILRAAGRRLVKLIPLDGKAEAYDSAYRFTGYTVSVAGIPDLRTLLDRIRDETDCCVVRGALIALPPVQAMRRLIYADPDTGDAPTLKDVPRRWLALDHDGIEKPQDVPAADLLACADVVIDRLPKPFWHAACIVQATASHGVKPGIRLRTWHWCDRPMTGAEIKRWLGKLTDSSVLNACQPIYTGRPIFGAGRTEHLPFRLTEWPGDQWLRCPPPEELMPPPPRVQDAVRPAHAAGSARARLYVEAVLNNAQSRIATASLRHPAILMEACCLAKFVHAGLITRSDLHSTLWAGARAAGKDDEAEITRMIDFGLQHPDNSKLPEDIRNG